jgi:hypothetical protein
MRTRNAGHIHFRAILLQIGVIDHVSLAHLPYTYCFFGHIIFASYIVWQVCSSKSSGISMNLQSLLSYIQMIVAGILWELLMQVSWILMWDVYLQGSMLIFVVLSHDYVIESDAQY